MTADETLARRALVEAWLLDHGRRVGLLTVSTDEGTFEVHPLIGGVTSGEPGVGRTLVEAEADLGPRLQDPKTLAGTRPFDPPCPNCGGGDLKVLEDTELRVAHYTCKGCGHRWKGEM